MTKDQTSFPNKSMNRHRSGELGQGRLKLLIFLLIVFAVGSTAYQYIPVAWQAFQYKDLMQHDVDVAATEGYDVAWVKTQLAKAGPDYGVPVDAQILPLQRDGRMEVTVRFSRQIPLPLPGYNYEYNFDHTARSSQFFVNK
jgi:hypothetical protein